MTPLLPYSPLKLQSNYSPSLHLSSGLAPSNHSLPPPPTSERDQQLDREKQSFSYQPLGVQNGLPNPTSEKVEVRCAALVDQNLEDSNELYEKKKQMRMFEAEIIKVREQIEEDLLLSPGKSLPFLFPL
jgi:hypothetical protein